MTHDCLSNLLGIICSVFDAYSSVLFLPGENRPGAYGIAATFSLGDDIDPATSITPGQGVVGWIIRNKRPLLINNFDQKQSHLGYYPSKKEAKIKAFMGTPLASGRGALCLDSKRTYSFSDKDQKILALFATLADDIRQDSCLLVKNRDQRRYYGHLQLIHGLRGRFPKWSVFLSHFLEVMAEASGFEFCFLAARDEMGTSYFLEGYNRPLFAEAKRHQDRFPIKGGLVGWVFNNHSPIFLGEKDARPGGASLFGERDAKSTTVNSVICLPLIMNRKTRCVLVLADPGSKPVSPELKTFVEMAVDNLGLFLENLYLKNRLHDS